MYMLSTLCKNIEMQKVFPRLADFGAGQCRNGPLPNCGGGCRPREDLAGNTGVAWGHLGSRCFCVLTAGWRRTHQQFCTHRSRFFLWVIVDSSRFVHEGTTRKSEAVL